MIFGSIRFLNTGKYKCLQKKLVNKEISFATKSDRPWKDKIASIVVLIGENGVGKTSLLSWLKRLFCLLKGCIRHIGVNECSLPNSLFHNDGLKNNEIINNLFSDRNYLYINFYTKEKWYSIRIYFISDDSNLWTFEILQLCRGGYEWKKINRFVEHNWIFMKKNFPWDEDFCDYDGSKFLFFNDSVDYSHMLETVKNEIEEKYFREYLETEKKLQDINRVSEENKKQNIDSLKTNFKLLIDELYRITRIRISTKENNAKNKKITISENDDVNYDLSNLSSGQKKLLVIWFKIIEIILFQKNECVGLLLFIDEIDNSFSPKWQEKFTEVLVRLSKELNDKKITHQFFISTHSPSILKNLLNSNEVAIIDVKKGINIKDSDEKKILLNNKKNSYDEIMYLYYDIPTPSYYNSLYEKLKWKFDEYFEKKDLSKSKWDKCFSKFLCDIKLETLKDKIYKVDRIKSPDKLKEMKMEGQKKINVKDLDDFCDNLTLLRDMLAHDDGNENWNVGIYDYSENNWIFKKTRKINIFMNFLKNYLKINLNFFWMSKLKQ